MRYSAMLGHVDDPRSSPRFCCAGSAAVPGRAVVWPGRVAGARRAGVGRHPDHSPSVVSRVADRGSAGAERRRPGGAQAAPRPSAVGPSGGRAAERPGGSRLRHQSVDLAADRGGHRPRDRGAVSPGTCLAHPAGVELVVATARPPGAGAGRGGHWTVATPALAAGKKTRGAGTPG